MPKGSQVGKLVAAFDELTVFAGTQTDECARLRAENERLTKQWDEHCSYHGSESPHALNDALYRATDAESHCSALAQDATRLTADNKRLRAENERLRADVASADTNYHNEAKAHGATLAAATALLVRWNRGDHPFTATRVFLKTVGAPENAQPDSDHAADDCSLRTNAFLASASFEYVGSASSPLPPAFEAANAARQPAAPTVYHSRPGSDVVVTDQPAAPTRTAADEAVLDATDAIPESWLRGAVQASQLPRGLAPLAVAVLARRGLK
jgi:regulator of replication initiation timing